MAASKPCSSMASSSVVVCSRLLHAGHDEALAELLHQAIAVLDRLGEVVAGVHVHHRVGEARGPERLHREVHQDDGVLAAREEQHRPLALGGHLAEDVDRLRLQGTQVSELIRRRHRRERSLTLVPGSSQIPTGWVWNVPRASEPPAD
jgi:hypothetical protein